MPRGKLNCAAVPIALVEPALPEPARVVNANGSGGVTGAVAGEGRLVPAEFVAVIVKVYATPLVSPVTTIGEDVPMTMPPPGFAVTAKPVTVAPPVLEGGWNVTVT
jgi:hypothetical protein